MVAQKKQKAGKWSIQTFLLYWLSVQMPFFHLECENHNMRSSIYMRGQNKSNLYFVESLVETESEDTV